MQRRYRRYFIMLEIEDKGFGISKKESPKGYGKVEIKNQQGTLAINCQNFKVDQGKNRYRWYLINTKKEEEPSIVEVGPMEIDEKGKGEIVWEFNAENVRGSMEEIDNFNVLVLAAQNKEDRNNLLVPLVGYIDKEKDSSWRYALERYLYIPSRKEKIASEELKEKPKQELVQESKQEILPKSLEPKKEYVPSKEDIKENTEKEVKEEAKENIKDQAREETKENIKDQAREEAKEQLEEQVKEEAKVKQDIDNEGTEEQQKDIKKQFEKEQPPVEEEKAQIKEEPIRKQKATQEKEANIEDDYSVQLQGYIENALKGFQPFNPLISSLEEHLWWKIPYNHQTMYRSYMPFISYLDFAISPSTYYGSKIPQMLYLYQYHIFGISYDLDGSVKYYVYGIPGRGLSVEQPYEGAHWQQCNQFFYNTYSNGYWLLFIDAKTGKLIKDKQRLSSDGV